VAERLSDVCCPVVVMLPDIATTPVRVAEPLTTSTSVVMTSEFCTSAVRICVVTVLALMSLRMRLIDISCQKKRRNDLKWRRLVAR
jgi:hypothetical protein